VVVGLVSMGARERGMGLCRRTLREPHFACTCVHPPGPPLSLAGGERAGMGHARGVLSGSVQVNSRTHVPWKLMLNFSMSQSGIDFKPLYPYVPKSP
jgi:hypothetical protein